MASLTLPSLEALQKAAEDPSSDQCPTLVLQALSYGTEAHEALEQRTAETSTLLTDAWTDFPSLEDALVDSLWLCSSMLASSSSSENAVKASTDALTAIVKNLVQVPDRTNFWGKCQRNLDPSLLDASGLASETELLKKLRMHNTQLHYKQQKYNLLQEESEGYSKVLQFLTTGSGTDAVERRARLRQLIGTFELDPNRVLDLLLDIVDLKLFPLGDELSSRKPDAGIHVLWLLDMMKDFSLDKLPALLTFKLAGDEKGAPRLLRTIAFLASENLLDLKTMVTKYFPPIEDDVEKAHTTLWKKEKRRIQALGRVSLSGNAKEDPKLAELAEQLQQSLEPLEKSQVVHLFLVLLEWGEWERVKPLLSLEVWGKLCRLLPTKFGFALCDVAHQRILSWCKSKSPTPMLGKEVDATDDSDILETYPDLTLDKVVQAVFDLLLCTVQSACISHRPILFCRLCRLVRSLLGNEESEVELSDATYKLFKTFLVPSLSLFPSNPAISTELWAVLKCLPYATRYRLYGDWTGAGLGKEGLVSSSSGKPLPNVESEMNAGKAVRYALKRLSKDNIRDMSRQLAKVTHSNPMVVFATILGQIESYDNMVEVMVEATRFVDPLGLDVLGYCLLSRLSGIAGGVNRSRLKEDGVHVSQWLQSLETFSGAFYKRCPFVEFRGMLCYLMRRLKDGNVMELGILRTMLKGPGGYGFADFSPAASLSVTQLEGRAGSITLKRETMSFGIVEEVNHRASERIREVLQTDGFGVSMLILIAQVRSRIVFESSSKGQKKPVKLIGNLYDSCQVVMSILLEFLTDAVDEKGGNGDIVESSAIARYAEFLPTLEELDSRYGFDAVSAWTLCRPLVRAANKAVAKQEQAKPTGGFQRRLSCFALTEDSRKSYQDMLPESTWSAISPRLFECFYTNSLHDLFCPETIYNGEITRVTKEIERIKQRQKGSALNSLQPAGAPPKNEDDELKRLEVVSTTLSSDLSKQKDHAISILTSMEANKSAFFPSEKASRHAANTFVTQCVFPRSMQSPDDALYCAHFISQLHKIETPGFSTLHYIDEFISVVSGALFGITEGEAAHLAILLWETWKVVNKWRYDEKAFDEEVAGKPGSYIESSSKLSSEDSSDEEIVPITYKDFAKLYNKWHSSLGAALIGCLQSVEYMHTRAGLLVLTRIVEVFPTRPKLGNELQAVLSPLQDESSSRLDIRASASAYGTMLLKARDDGKWVEEDASVAKARVEKERAAAQERKKKIAEQFQEMKRESEQITEEIGPRDGPRDRNDRRRLPPRDVGASRTPPPATNGTENGGPARGNKDERTTNRPPVIRPESGEVSGRDRRDHQERRGEPLSRPSPPREGGRGRDRGALEDRDRGRNESHGGSAGRPGDRPDARGRDGGSGDGEPHRVGRDEGRSLEGRWARGEKQTEGRSTGRTSKRSRPSSPEGGNDSGRADDRSSKRARTNQGPAGARDYDSRRDRVSPPPRRRGASPPRTPPPARPPPRSKRSRR